MRKVKFFLFVITVCALFASCDKMTNNGNLDGMWQLISVSYNKTGGEDSIVNVKNERVYMNFQQKLGQITPGTFRTDSMGRYLLMRFEKKSGMLKLHDFYVFYETAGPLGTERHSEEKLLSDSATTLLQPFGIDGLFANFNILKLTGSSMILQSDYARLVMRKF